MAQNPGVGGGLVCPLRSCMDNIRLTERDLCVVVSTSTVLTLSAKCTLPSALSCDPHLISTLGIAAFHSEPPEWESPRGCFLPKRRKKHANWNCFVMTAGDMVTHGSDVCPCTFSPGAPLVSRWKDRLLTHGAPCGCSANLDLNSHRQSQH